MLPCLVLVIMIVSVTVMVVAIAIAVVGIGGAHRAAPTARACAADALELRPDRYDELQLLRGQLLRRTIGQRLRAADDLPQHCRCDEA
ncbi:MAG: hypothetical protein J2P54_17175, partial [Bradyrhizobiaceae bacterium]|nr:hypothetical protein [Bradyrhizobiaceae bacterium]